MSRPDTYIIELETVKNNLVTQIMHCRISLNFLQDIKLNENYDDAATILEKSNIDNLITLITNGISILEAIVWE